MMHLPFQLQLWREQHLMYLPLNWSLAMNHTLYLFLCSFVFGEKEILPQFVLVLKRNYLSHYQLIKSNFKKCPHVKDRGSLMAASIHKNIWSNDVWWRGDANLIKTSKTSWQTTSWCLIILFYLDLLYGIICPFFIPSLWCVKKLLQFWSNKMYLLYTSIQNMWVFFL